MASGVLLKIPARHPGAGVAECCRQNPMMRYSDRKQKIARPGGFFKCHPEQKAGSRPSISPPFRSGGSSYRFGGIFRKINEIFFG